jgi:hypothetical protein
MMITRKAMHRRTVLRGTGAVIALPLLDAMGSSAKAVETAAASRKRLQVIYTPNGMVMKDWTSRRRRARLCHDRPSSSRWKPIATVRGGQRTWITCRPKRWVTARAIMPAAAAPSDRRACQEDRRRRHQQRRFDGPDCGQAVCGTDPDPVAGAGPGIAQPGGKLRQRLFLRLYQHPVLVWRSLADADHHQPARSVRTPVWRKRSGWTPRRA